MSQSGGVLAMFGKVGSGVTALDELGHQHHVLASGIPSSQVTRIKAYTGTVIHN
jgi:hypothetical protein